MDHDNKDHWCQLPKESLHRQAPSPPQCYQKLYLFQRFVDRKLVRFGIFLYKSWNQPWSPGYDVLNDQLELLMSNHFGISSSFVFRMKFFFIMWRASFLFSLILTSLGHVHFSDGHFHVVVELKNCFHYQSHFTCLRKQISHSIAEKKFLLEEKENQGKGTFIQNSVMTCFSH